ncbi:response regulator [Jiella mangrovi]|uniref:Response regulatory domain-containing protein n=1 Tax=Jiella mangrovi TaxID=2821407 RepID=A0ABS4BJ70_9HYPH|nr:response regulator [Jiella mangrovi]MBP0616808.1 hypothetical protein [Jiella mangrovi]
MTETPEAVCIIVDDDPDIRRIIFHPLKRRGFTAIDCGSLAELEAAISKVKPSLVFLDAGLPDTEVADPFETLSRAHCNAWVQLISGMSQVDLAELALAGEDCGLRMLPPMTKPFRPGAIAAVAELVGASGAGDSR